MSARKRPAKPAPPVESKRPPRTNAKTGANYANPIRETPKIGHRPAYAASERDRQTVQVMIAGGIEQSHICGLLGITGKTLRKHYRNEVTNGATSVNAIVVAEHLKRIKLGDFNAIKWWEQSRMGWAERIVVADGGVDDSDVSALSDAQIEQRIAALSRKRPAR